MSEYFNSDAEVAILSLIVKEPDLIFEVPDLRGEFFSSIPNKCLFDQIHTLIHSGIGLEYNLLLSYLQAGNKLMECGGKEYLEYLLKQDYKREYLKDFEKILIDSFKARTLITLSSKVPDIVKSQYGIDGALKYIQDNLERLSNLSADFKTISLLDATKETWERIVEKVENPNKVSLTTGFKNIDAVTGGYEAGQLWVVAGRPGMGKSASMINSSVRSSKTGISNLIFSREMNRTSLVTRMVSLESGIPIYNIRLGLLNNKDLDRVAETIKEIKDYPIYIDTNFSGNENYIYSTIRRYAELYNVKIVHLDYIQLVAERSIESVHELGRISRALKLLAEELEIVCVVYSQLNRKCEERNDKRPMLSDIKQSGSIEDDADLVNFLYRDEMYNRDSKHKGLIEQIIAKQRNGPIGTVLSNFDADTNLITEAK